MHFARRSNWETFKEIERLKDRHLFMLNICTILETFVVSRNSFETCRMNQEVKF
jgi:hypothetical protein